MIRAAVTVEQLWQPAPGGSGTYIAELLRAFEGRSDLQVEGVAAWHPRHERDGRAGSAPVRYSRLPRRALYEAWARSRRPRAGGSDVVHATTWALPGHRAPLVVTIHDLAFLRTPEHFTAHGARYFQRALATARDEATRVIVPSTVTADDVAGWGIERDRIVVIPHGVRAQHVSEAEVGEWRLRFAVRGPYVLWCGTVEPRKNLGRLVEAFTAARAEGLDAQLVLAGPDGWGSVPDQLREAVDRSEADSIRRTGRLGDRDLQIAFAGATAFAFPSLWEGFGMPVLEAMAHGVPVVVSAGTAPAEFATGAGALVDPHSVEQIAAGLLQVARRPPDRQAIRRAAGRFTWAASAEAHAKVYHEAAVRG